MSDEPSSARLIGTLTAAGLSSGLLLVGVYSVTQPIIDANDAAALERAVFQVLPGTTAMEPLVLRGGELQRAVGAADEEELDRIYLGRDESGALTGYAIPWQGAGFQDVIKLIYGFEPERRMVVGMEILQSAETPGLGDKIFKDQAFVSNFDALVVDPEIVPVPKGAKTQAHEVDCITGATISSKAVVKIVNAGNAQWLGLLPEGDPWGQAAPSPTPEPPQPLSPEGSGEPDGEAQEEVTP
jgi:electron transport complex protein RnfG